MKGRMRGTRRGLGPLLAVTMTALGILVPILDGDESGRRPVLESEHSAATCVVVHDHTVCTQAGANRAVASDAPRHQPHAGPAPAPAAERSDRPHPAALALGCRSRAPPAA